ncbi:FUSC family protein [Gryllotalpicola protaetiae]|uniref:FUSC family protein n=1 Tax=Gryllotalpicola protaetiae TaxID=2419771 RepID=A0A387BK88_9MICO|nr:FUSC family protein [Gryllotalpicola protaetiae]AYG02712.1 FUSC family protein [Gryllotalpicola protaetiae]
MSLARLRAGAGFAVASVIAALLSFWTIAYFARNQTLVIQLCISGVIIALSIVRSDERSAGPGGGGRMPQWVTWVARFALIPLVALLGSALGHVVRSDAALGFALIGVPLVAAIWVRRFGPVWTRLGSLWSFPFIASLVTPAAALAAGAGVWWGALAALIAVGWGSILGWLVTSAGRLSRDAAEWRPDAPAPANGLHSPAAQASRPAENGTRKLAASDRMALHLAISLAAAILLGWWLLPDHLGWFVLTAYIVNSGNRGRGDVVYKGVQRLIGAGVGTVAATLLGTLYAPGDSTAIVALFVILGVGAVLRTVSYAWWAASMTGGLSLLYDFLGQGGTDVLGQRLLAILLGGLIAIAASSFIAPVRSIDVARRRTADLLGLGREVLTGERSAPSYPALAPEVREASARIAQLAPPFHALRIVTFGRIARARRTADLIDRAAALGAGLERFIAAPSRELGADLGGELRGLREVLVSLRRD